MKSFVIYLKGIKESEDLASDCIKSAKEFNLTVEKFNGIHGNETIESTMNSYSIFPFSPKMKKNRLGVKGCFLSHFLLWLKSVNLNESLMIFEHDAVLLREIPENIEEKFDEFLLLDPFNKFSSNYSYSHYQSRFRKQEVIEYFNNQSKKKYGLSSEYAMGLQAYIIKPKAASKLIEEVKEKGFYPADMQCNKDILNLETVNQSLASINPIFYNNKELMTKMSTTQRL